MGMIPLGVVGMRKLTVILALISGFAHPATAAPLSSIAMMNGRCTGLMFGGKDGSRVCGPKVVNTVYRDGRTGFTFVVGDIAVVTFSGSASQVKDTADIATQPLDKVIFTLTGTGTPPNALKAAGVCTFSNPYAGVSTIDCTAHTSSGIFRASFVSDGKEPSIQEF